MTSLFVDWEPDIIAFSLGSFAVRWYSLCWCIGLMSVYVLEHHLYKEQKLGEEKFEPLFLYCFVGILVGARLGHCIFYEPDTYLTSWKGFVSMILPVQIDDKWDMKFTGYEGLASHGGTLGLMFALWLFVRKTKLNLMRVLDNIAIVTPICACAIRIGNLMNSEIIGRVTDVPWAFRFFKSNEAMQTLDKALSLPGNPVPLPRHPGQLYEAICYAIFFFIGWYFYKHRPEKVGTGFFFGLCLTLIFTARFIIEFTKEVQGGIDNGSLPFDMGQLLSIPFVLLGLYCMFGGKYCKKLAEK